MAKLPNIIVTGTPGAWVNRAMMAFEKKGWYVTWPDQDLSSETATAYLNRNHQNIVVQQIVNSICDAHSCGLMSQNLPDFYDVPFPGPKEFFHNFAKSNVFSVAVAAIGLGLFLDIWLNHVDFVVDITASDQEDLEVLSVLTQGELSPKQLASLRDYQIQRYHEKLKQFPYVYSMSNQEVKAKDYGAFMEYIDAKS